MIVLAVLLPMMAGCPAVDFWTIPPSEPGQYDKGLVVLYPGSANLRIEMSAVYDAIRAEGGDMAIEEVIWGTWLEHFFDPFNSQPRFQERAEAEAARLAEYVRSHPDAPVTLITFSGGAHFAFLTAAAMPDDAPLDRVITLSPGIANDYDLMPALEHLSQGIVNYWSPLESGPTIIGHLLGLADGAHAVAAATTGYLMEDEKVIQISWTPEMRAYGNNGEHLDYFLNVEFLRKYIVPWVPLEKAASARSVNDLAVNSARTDISAGGETGEPAHTRDYGCPPEAPSVNSSASNP